MLPRPGVLCFAIAYSATVGRRACVHAPRAPHRVPPDRARPRRVQCPLHESLHTLVSQQGDVQVMNPPWTSPTHIDTSPSSSSLPSRPGALPPRAPPGSRINPRWWTSTSRAPTRSEPPSSRRRSSPARRPGWEPLNPFVPPNYFDANAWQADLRRIERYYQSQGSIRPRSSPRTARGRARRAGGEGARGGAHPCHRPQCDGDGGAATGAPREGAGGAAAGAGEGVPRGGLGVGEGDGAAATARAGLRRGGGGRRGPWTWSRGEPRWTCRHRARATASAESSWPRMPTRRCHPSASASRPWEPSAWATGTASRPWPRRRRASSAWASSAR